MRLYCKFSLINFTMTVVCYQDQSCFVVGCVDSAQLPALRGKSFFPSWASVATSHSLLVAR